MDFELWPHNSNQFIVVSLRTFVPNLKKVAFTKMGPMEKDKLIIQRCYKTQSFNFDNLCMISSCSSCFFFLKANDANNANKLLLQHTKKKTRLAGFIHTENILFNSLFKNFLIVFNAVNIQVASCSGLRASWERNIQRRNEELQTSDPQEVR